MKEAVRSARTNALKQGDKLVFSVLTMVVNNAETRAKADGNRTSVDDDYLHALKSEIKQNEEASALMKNAEARMKAEKEIELMSAYLPVQMADADLFEIVDRVYHDLIRNGITPSKGAMMKNCIQSCKAFHVDSSRVSRAVDMAIKKNA